MPDKDEKGLTELDWKAILYGEALSDKTLKAGRNLALVAVATLSVSVFNISLKAIPMLPLDFSKQPTALEMFLAVVNLALLGAFVLRAWPDLLRTREDWVDYVKFSERKRIKAAWTKADKEESKNMAEMSDDFQIEPDGWQKYVIDIEDAAEERITKLEAQFGDRKVPKAVRHARLWFFGAGPLLIGFIAFVHTSGRAWEFFLAVVGMAGKAT